MVPKTMEQDRYGRSESRPEEVMTREGRNVFGKSVKVTAEGEAATEHQEWLLRGQLTGNNWSRNLV